MKGLLIVMGVVLVVALFIALLELAIAGQLEALRSGVRTLLTIQDTHTHTLSLFRSGHS